jgi:hypothetical protein
MFESEKLKNNIKTSKLHKRFQIKKNYQLKTTYMFIQFRFKIGFLNLFWS